MQKSIFYTLIMGLFVFGACHTSKKLASDSANQTDMGQIPTITDTKWQLVEINGKSVPDTINGKLPFLQLSKDKMRYTGTAGCNGIGGEFKLSDDHTIKFSRGMSTMMACQHMEYEKSFNQMLEVADNYKQQGNTLSFFQGNKELAKFEAVQADDMASTLNGTWELNYITGPRITFAGLYPDKKPTITFNLKDHKASGNSSCNNYNMAFTLDGNQIHFDDPVSTRMACQGAGEPTYFKTLKTVDHYSVTDGNTLNLIMGDIAVMRFERKD